MINLLKSEETNPIKIYFFKILSKILRLSWWLEIKTTIPSCTYYFGPFSSKKNAKIAQYDYIKDLLQEKAYGITVEIKRQSQPKELTIYED
ncbi:MAG: DUF1816 domain-containing protein [Xenococcaceae cyanobacterium]